MGESPSNASPRRRRHWLEWVALILAVMAICGFLTLMAMLSWWVITGNDVCNSETGCLGLGVVVPLVSR